MFFWGGGKGKGGQWWVGIDTAAEAFASFVKCCISLWGYQTPRLLYHAEIRDGSITSGCGENHRRHREHKRQWGIRDWQLGMLLNNSVTCVTR
jgi:hypothetical protein